MVHNQANNLILLLALVSATLLGLVLRCQAGEGHDEEIERTKKEWLADWDERVGEHMVGKVTPEATAEILKQLHAAMPEDDSSEEWLKKRTELDNLVDMVNMNEECRADYVVERFNKRYDLSGYLLPVWPLLLDYAKYFKNKQIEICAATITSQMSIAVAGVSEADKRDIEALMSYSPKLKASDNLEWDSHFVGALEREDEAQFRKEIYRFLKAKESFFSAQVPSQNAGWVVDKMFDVRMGFCRRVRSATMIPVNKYLDIRRGAKLDDGWLTRFSPETLKWVKAAKLCWQINFNEDKVKAVVYNEYKRDHQNEYKQLKKANKPSRASKILDRLRPKKNKLN